VFLCEPHVRVYDRYFCALLLFSFGRCSLVRAFMLQPVSTILYLKSCRDQETAEAYMWHCVAHICPHRSAVPGFAPEQSSRCLFSDVPSRCWVLFTPPRLMGLGTVLFPSIHMIFFSSFILSSPPSAVFLVIILNLDSSCVIYLIQFVPQAQNRPSSLSQFASPANVC